MAADFAAAVVVVGTAGIGSGVAVAAVVVVAAVVAVVVRDLNSAGRKWNKC